MRPRPGFAVLTVGLLSLAIGREARAGDASPEAGAGAEAADQGWRLDIGAGVLANPVFPGAKDLRVLPIPSIEVHQGDRVFASIREGVGYNLLRWKGLVAGPVVNFAFPRDESDQRAALSGLGNVAFTVEAGGFIRYNLGRVASVKVEARQGVNGHNGLVIDGAVDLDAPPLANNRLFLSVGPRVSVYDHHYAQAYYGVTGQQSARSGYDAFRPGEGYKAGVGAAAVYLPTRRITLTAFGDYGRLLGAIARSPIVLGRYGSRDAFTIGASASYRFRFGG